MRAGCWNSAACAVGESLVQRKLLHPCIDRCVMPSIVCQEAVTVENVGAFLSRNYETGVSGGISDFWK